MGLSEELEHLLDGSTVSGKMASTEQSLAETTKPRLLPGEGWSYYLKGTCKDNLQGAASKT